MSQNVYLWSCLANRTTVCSRSLNPFHIVIIYKLSHDLTFSNLFDRSLLAPTTSRTRWREATRRSRLPRCGSTRTMTPASLSTMSRSSSWRSLWSSAIPSRLSLWLLWVRSPTLCPRTSYFHSILIISKWTRLLGHTVISK